MAEINHTEIEQVTTLLNMFNARRTTFRQFSQWWHENRDGSPTEAETMDLIAFLQHESDRGLAPSSLQTRKSQLSVLYDAFVDFDAFDVTENPLDDIDVGRYVDDYGSTTSKEIYSENGDGIVYLTRDETQKLRENVPAPKVRNELLVKLMIQTGARRNEITTLQIDDVDREENTVKLRDDKTGNVRTVPFNDLSPELGAWLNRYRHGYKTARDSDRLFLSNEAGELSPQRINSIVREAAENAGIQSTMYTDAMGRERYRVTAHALRHTYAVRLVEQDVSIRMLQELLGHSDISMTQVYLKVGSDEAVDAYRDANVTFE